MLHPSVGVSESGAHALRWNRAKQRELRAEFQGEFDFSVRSCKGKQITAIRRGLAKQKHSSLERKTGDEKKTKSTYGDDV